MIIELVLITGVVIRYVVIISLFEIPHDVTSIMWFSVKTKLISFLLTHKGMYSLHGNPKKRGGGSQKRARRGKRRKNTKFQMVRFRGIGLPDTLKMEMVYTERVSRAPVQTTDEYVFTGNGLFDPNITGTGLQPVYYDQISTLYSRSRVISSSVNLELINLQTSSGTYISLVPSILAAGYTLLTDAVSQRYSRHTFMGIKDGMGKARLGNYCSTSKIYGIRNIMWDENFSAESGFNPPNVWYWIINAYSAQNPDNLAYDFLIKITYRVIWSERVAADLSLLQDRTKKHHEILQRKKDSALLQNNSSNEFFEVKDQ